MAWNHAPPRRHLALLALDVALRATLFIWVDCARWGQARPKLLGDLYGSRQPSCRDGYEAGQSEGTWYKDTRRLMRWCRKGGTYHTGSCTASSRFQQSPPFPLVVRREIKKIGCVKVEVAALSSSLGTFISLNVSYYANKGGPQWYAIMRICFDHYLRVSWSVLWTPLARAPDSSLLSKHSKPSNQHDGSEYLILRFTRLWAASYFAFKFWYIARCVVQRGIFWEYCPPTSHDGEGVHYLRCLLWCTTTDWNSNSYSTPYGKIIYPWG